MRNILLKDAAIFRRYFIMHLKKLMEYKINVIMDFLVRFSEALLFFAFWAVLIGAGAGVPGWDLKGFLLIFAFESVFVVLLLSVGYGAAFVWEQIQKGSLDKFLARPTTPWLMLLMEEFWPEFFGLIISIVFFAIAVFAFGIQIGIIEFFLIAAMILVGVLIPTLLGLCLSTLAFWFGNLEFIEYLFDAFWTFEYYPATIFPVAVQGLIAFTFPFLFVHTVPAMLLLEQLTVRQALFYLSLEICVVAIWFVFFKFLWGIGVKHYESYGG